LIGAGASLALAGSASAQTIEHRCNADGCWNVACYDDGSCRRVWDEDQYDRRHYSTTTSYDGYRANGRYIGNTWVPYDQNHRRAWLCDTDGDNCHWGYESY
jgi:hypothetical protein